MSELKNCNRCGRIYSSNRFYDLCPICFELEKNEYDVIRAYLYEHPGAKVFEVATILDIAVSRIKRYLRQGRLEIIGHTNQFLACELCRTPIRSGKYCDQCEKKASHDFKVIYNENSENKSNSRINFHCSSSSSSKKVAVR